MYELPRARADDPETSHEAAAKVSRKVHKVDAVILGYLAARTDGATSYEIAEGTQLARVTVSPRLRPLTRMGLTVDSGERRLVATGSKGIVWKLVDANA